MSEHHVVTGICIGGPFDGQRVTHNPEMEWFEAAVEQPMTAERFAELRDAPVTMRVKTAMYQRATLGGDGTRFYAWMVEGMGYDELLRRLLDRYAEGPCDAR